MDLTAFTIGVLSTIPCLLATLTGLIIALRRIRDVHTIVNSQRTEMVDKIDSLKQEIANLKLHAEKLLVINQK